MLDSCGRRALRAGTVDGAQMPHRPTTFALLSALLVGAAILPHAVSNAQDQGEIARMKSEYRRPAPRPVQNPALVELGRELFFDPRISASGKTACSNCHFQELGWGVTDARSRTDSGTQTSRKSQPLVGIGHAGKAPVGWDGRSATLEAQVQSSIATGSMSMRETSTPVKVEVIEERIRSDRNYAAKFQQSLPGSSINLDTIATAIAAFERTLEPKPAPFDRWIEGDEQAISQSARRGFALFNTTKSMCFTCHTGWRFTDDKFHDIGTTTSDLGRGRVVKDDESMQYAFKTPTLRSVRVRPPYMHNATQATLHDVMKHYEKGGINRPSRSPLMMPIQLTDQERNDLIAFMETLN